MWTIVIGIYGDGDCAWPEEMVLTFGIYTVPQRMIEEKQLL